MQSGDSRLDSRPLCAGKDHDGADIRREVGRGRVRAQTDDPCDASAAGLVIGVRAAQVEDREHALIGSSAPYLLRARE